MPVNNEENTFEPSEQTNDDVDMNDDTVLWKTSSRPILFSEN